MTQRIDKSSGFTLIELLVVIAIIGILSSVVLAALSNARASARDSFRVQALRNMQTALEMYYNDHDQYPTPSGTWGTGCSAFSPDGYGETGYIPGLVPDYMDQLPEDPRCGENYNDGTSYATEFWYRSDGKDYKVLNMNAVETFDPNNGHPLDDQRSNQSISISTDGGAGW